MSPAAQPAPGRPKSATRTPRPSSEAASYAINGGVRSRMQQQRTRDTAPELAVRRRLHAMGLRYRVDAVPLPRLRRRADLVSAPLGSPCSSTAASGTAAPSTATPAQPPTAGTGRAKIAGNRERDQDTDRRLADAGWLVVRVWEHEPAAEVAARIADLVTDRRPTRRTGPARQRTVPATRWQ